MSLWEGIQWKETGLPWVLKVSSCSKWFAWFEVQSTCCDLEGLAMLLGYL